MNYLSSQGLSTLITSLADKLKPIFNNKVDKEVGKGLSDNNYTTEDKNKVKNISKFYRVGLDSSDNVTFTDAELTYNNIYDRLNKAEDFIVIDNNGLSTFVIPCKGLLDTTSNNIMFCSSILQGNELMSYTFILDTSDRLTLVGKVPIPPRITRLPDLLWEYNPMQITISGQSANLFTNPTWYPIDADFSKYKRIRFYFTPSKHSVGLSTNNLTAPIYVDVFLESHNLTTDILYYSGGSVTTCLNNDNRLFAVTILVTFDTSVNMWKIAVKEVSLYGTSSTNISDNYLYKIEGYYN